MGNEISFTNPPSDYTVLQQFGGGAALELRGRYATDDEANYPVLNVYDEDTNACLRRELCPECALGSWRCRLWLDAGKSYRIEAGIQLRQSGFDGRFIGRGQVIRQLGVGEVFVVSGQSNAVGYARQPAHDPPALAVRMRLPGGGWQVASHPIGFVPAGVPAPNGDILNPGHSPWLHFGKLVAQHTGMPVGLIQTGQNGAGIENWRQDGPLCALMARPLEEKQAAHLIWYQGCTDAGEARHRDYRRRLTALMEDMAQLCEDITMIQVSGATTPGAPKDGWVQVREAQRGVAQQLGFRLVPTWDLSHYSDDVHLSSPDNLLLARRVFECLYRRPCPMATAARMGEGYVDIVLDSAAPLDMFLPPFALLDAAGAESPPTRIQMGRSHVRLYTSLDAVCLVRPAFTAHNPPRQDRGKPCVLSYFCLNVTQ